MPELLLGGVAVALVALAQAAGISAAVPNPDGSRPNMSVDFMAQGTGNLVGGFFGALPVGGSLSRTGVSTSAGAQTRWAGIFAGIWLTALVVVAGSAAEIIPMPVIGGLILVIGVELVIGRWPDIKLVLSVAPLSALAMLITFAATTQLPLHTAILIGVITSLVLYCVKASASAQLIAVKQTDDGGWQIVPVPDRVASNDVTVLHYAGVGLFAEVARIDEEWPRADGSHNAVVVLSIRVAARRAVVGGDQGATTLGRATDRAQRPADRLRRHPGGSAASSDAGALTRSSARTVWYRPGTSSSSPWKPRSSARRRGSPRSPTTVRTTLLLDVSKRRCR